MGKRGIGRAGGNMSPARSGGKKTRAVRWERRGGYTPCFRNRFLLADLEGRFLAVRTGASGLDRGDDAVVPRCRVGRQGERDRALPGSPLARDLDRRLSHGTVVQKDLPGLPDEDLRVGGGGEDGVGQVDVHRFPGGEGGRGGPDRFDLELGSPRGGIAILPAGLRAVLLLLVEVVPGRAAGQPPEETADQRTPFPPDEPPHAGAPPAPR